MEIIQGVPKKDEGAMTPAEALAKAATIGTGNMVKICNQGGIIVTVVPNPGVLP